MNPEQLSILVVDDDPNNISTIIELLGKMGFKKRVYSAPNGKIALRIALERIPNLVITDWEMPEMNGLELVKSIQGNENLSQTRIIMVTAVMTEATQLKEAFDHGAHDFLRKPFDELEFFARITNTLNLIQAENRILEQRDKLQILDESKKRFFVNIAHDLRLPLTLVLGQSDLILDDYHDYLTQTVEKKVELIKKSGLKLKGLIEEIAELIELDSGNLPIHKTHISFSTILNEVVQILNPIFESKNIQLITPAIQNKADDFFVDPALFEKVLFNLLSNSLKYTPVNGIVQVHFQKTDSDILIDVADNGSGIKKEDIPRIFDRYFKHRGDVKSFRTGLGIGVGLALSKEIVVAHNGKITADSDENGTKISISIPIKTNAKVELVSSYDSKLGERTILTNEFIGSTPKTSGIFHETKNSKGTILLIEDYEEVRVFIREILIKDYSIIEAVDGIDALRQMERYQVDLIVTDLLMPAMDGFQFLKALRENPKYSTIPGLVISSRFTKEDQLTALDYGVNNFIQKPFKAEELKLRIRNLLNQQNHKPASITDLFGNYDIATANQRLIQKLESYVLARIDDSSLSIHELADEVAFSDRKLFRFLKETMEITPLEFIKQIRFQQVRNLIKYGKINSTTEAAKSIGMNNVSLFKIQYKSRFGEEPKV